MLKIGNNTSNFIKSLLQIQIRHLQPYSTSTLLLSNYLISLGLSREEANNLVSKKNLGECWSNKRRSKRPIIAAHEPPELQVWRNRGAKTVADLNFLANANSVVSYLKHDVGFRESHIRILVSNSPKILLFKVKTLKPKIQVFLNYGFTLNNICSLVFGSNPTIFDQGLNSVIVPSLQCLKEIMGDTDDMIEIVSSLLLRDLHLGKVCKFFVPNFNLLRDYGIPVSFIRKWIPPNTSICFVDVEAFKNAVIFVDQSLGIPRDSENFVKAVKTKVLDHKAQIWKAKLSENSNNIIPTCTSDVIHVTIDNTPYDL